MSGLIVYTGENTKVRDTTCLPLHLRMAFDEDYQQHYQPLLDMDRTVNLCQCNTAFSSHTRNKPLWCRATTQSCQCCNYDCMVITQTQEYKYTVNVGWTKRTKVHSHAVLLQFMFPDIRGPNHASHSDTVRGIGKNFDRGVTSFFYL